MKKNIYSTMIVDKVISTTLDLFDAADVYDVNVKSMLFRLLKKKFNHVCFSSMLILDIQDIIRWSNRRASTVRLDSAFSIDVQFLARGIVYNTGEVIHGCKIISIQNTAIVVQNDVIAGMLESSIPAAITNVLQVNMVIPVIVKTIKYNVGLDKISMRCVPYYPIPLKKIFYNIQGVISETDEKTESLINMYKEELAEHSKIEKEKSYEIFKMLMYPYKTQQKFNLTKIGEKYKPIKVDEILSMKSSDSTYCLILPEVSDEIYISKTEETSEDDGVNIIYSKCNVALQEILMSKLFYLRALREFIKQYPTPADFDLQNMKSYWKICNSLKQ